MIAKNIRKILITMEIKKISKKEIPLTYGCSMARAYERGLIGYVRADFGKNGNEFFSSWWSYNDDLKTMYFKNDLKVVIDTFRRDGCFLHDRDSLLQFCQSGTPLKFVGIDYWGIRVNTHDYMFLFRLFPYKGDYNFYCMCYKRDLLEAYLKAAE